jgi:hypothetical protein
VLRKDQSGPPDESSHRLGSRAGKQQGERRRLFQGQPAHATFVIDDLSFDQFREHIFARLGFPFGQLT